MDTISPTTNGKTSGVIRRVIPRKHRDPPAWTAFYARVLPIDPVAAGLHAVLQHYQRNEGRPITAAELAPAPQIRMRPQTVSRILRRLQRDGLAEHQGNGWRALVPKGSNWTRCEAYTLLYLTQFLPRAGLALWCRIENLTGNDGCYATVEYLGRLVGLEERQARKVLRKMESAGVIEVDFQPEDHPRAIPGRMDGRTNIYRPRRLLWACSCGCGVTSADGL